MILIGKKFPTQRPEKKVIELLKIKRQGEKLRYDEAKPGEMGHKGESHWHRFNPDKTSKFDEYLDANDNPVPDHSEESHLYPP